LEFPVGASVSGTMSLQVGTEDWTSGRRDACWLTAVDVLIVCHQNKRSGVL
jgi:hypothetical protein